MMKETQNWSRQNHDCCCFMLLYDGKFQSCRAYEKKNMKTQRLIRLDKHTNIELAATACQPNIHENQKQEIKQKTKTEDEDKIENIVKTKTTTKTTTFPPYYPDIKPG